MVRSKDVPKKPRDPLLTPPSKLRGASFPDEAGRPGNRGGAAMSPAPASVPSYMRGTSSSDAKGGQRGRARFAAPAGASVPGHTRAASCSNAKGGQRRRARLAAAAASAPPTRRRAVRVVTRGKVLFPEPGSAPGPGLGRATCSSTLKGARFPDALDLAPGATVAEGPAAMRVCPYTYCSLNGHAHAPAVPLRSFLASRRRLIQTQQSMKLKGVSAFRKKSGEKIGGGDGAAAAKVAPLVDEEAVGDFFIEVYAGPRVSSDLSCSDMSVDEMDATVRKMEFLVFDRCGADEDVEKEKDPVVGGQGEPDRRLEEKHGGFRDSSSVSSDAVSPGDFIEELPWMRYHGYEYDSLDDGISEEQRVRDDEIDRAHQISGTQDGSGNEGTSGRLVLESDIPGEQEGVVACHELDIRHEDSILDTLDHGEPSAGQATAEEKFPDPVDESEIPHQEVAGRVDSSTLEESCSEETSADQQLKDDESSVKPDGGSEVLESEIAGEQKGIACSVEVCHRKDEDSILNASSYHGEPSSGQVTEEEKFSEPVDVSEIPDQQVAGMVDGSILEAICFEETQADQQAQDDDSKSATTSDGVSEVIPADDSEMEISEDTVSNDGCRDDFSGEVTSKSALAEDMLEQHDGTEDESFGNDLSEQNGSPENAKSNAQKESGISTNEIDNASEGSDVVYNVVDSMKDAQKEMEVTTCEESGTASESNPDNASCFDDNAQVEPKSTKIMPKDASVGSDVSQGRSLDGNAECNANGAMGSEMTRCMLEDTYEETGIDEAAVEDDDSVRVRNDAGNDDLGMSECKLGDASKDLFTPVEAEQSDNSANVSSDAQNGSNQNKSELTLGISEDNENESKFITCQPKDVSEESGVSHESDHDGCSAYTTDGIQNESEFMAFESEGPQEDSDVVKEDVGMGICSDSQQKLGNTACESGDDSERSALSQEADRHVNIVDSGDNATDLKMDGSEDIQTAEESNIQLFNEEIPEPMYDCTAEDHADSRSRAAEVTDTKEPVIDDICDAFNNMNLKGDVYFDPEDSARCPRSKLIISRRRRTPEEEEYLRRFNPRAPNFLPLELDPDAEKVDLRHQMVDERKNAEEWMIDYALRRAVDNLAPARKKKVELLVQAFETVLPHDEDDKKSVTPPRPVQACN